MKPFSMVEISSAARALDNVEHMRKGEANYLSALMRPMDKMGFELPFGHPAVQQQAALVASILCDSAALVEAQWPKPEKERGKPCCLEHQGIKRLEKAVKIHPLGQWIEAQKGVGFKQAGRFLGDVGDPYWHNGFFDTGEVDKAGEPVMKAYDRPRTVSELWSYCGYSVSNGKAVHFQKGMQARWNTAARSRLWNIANSCLKTPGGYYEGIYREEREILADAVHSQDCVRCGPSGKPALAGSPLSDGHKHARALRMISKEFARDIWRESKRLHEELDQ